MENPQLRHKAFSEFFRYDDICDSLPTFSELSDSQIESNAIEGASSEKEVIFKKELGKLKPEYLEKSMRDEISRAPEAAAYICSLVASADSIAMWSQYGEHHHGIAFGIPSNLKRVIFERGRFLQQVEYPATNERPHTPFSNPKQEDVQHVLWTKGKEWEYQKEWRIISTNPDTDFLQPGGGC